jgi:hypothetical protein
MQHVPPPQRSQPNQTWRLSFALRRCGTLLGMTNFTFHSLFWHFCFLSSRHVRSLDTIRLHLTDFFPLAIYITAIYITVPNSSRAAKYRWTICVLNPYVISLYQTQWNWSTECYLSVLLTTVETVKHWKSFEAAGIGLITTSMYKCFVVLKNIFVLWLLTFDIIYC